MLMLDNNIIRRKSMQQLFVPKRKETNKVWISSQPFFQVNGQTDIKKKC